MIDAVLVYHTNLGDVFPSASSDDVPHRVVRDSVFMRESKDRSTGGVGSANGADGIVAEFGVVISDASGAAPLFKCIPHIVLLRPSEQVRRSHTSSHIAPMADAHGGIDLAVRFNPCHSVNKSNAAVGAVDMAIPVLIRGASPQPATIGFGDVAPQSFSNCSVSVSHG